MAARRLNLGDAECPWLKKSQGAADRKACDNCGTVYKVGIVQCPACQFVLDVKRYNQYITEGRIPGKPIKVA
jgi:hypothetical protein